MDAIVMVRGDVVHVLSHDGHPVDEVSLALTPWGPAALAGTARAPAVLPALPHERRFLQHNITPLIFESKLYMKLYMKTVYEKLKN